MLVSSLFVRHKEPPPRFAAGLFLFLVAVFVLLGELKPVYGLIGLGTTVIIAGALIELNKDRIWDNYLKTYKKNKSLRGVWHKPNKVYYNINVYLVWPFVIFMGLICLWTAYILS